MQHIGKLKFNYQVTMDTTIAAGMTELQLQELPKPKTYDVPEYDRFDDSVSVDLDLLKQYHVICRKQISAELRLEEENARIKRRKYINKSKYDKKSAELGKRNVKAELKRLKRDRKNLKAKLLLRSSIQFKPYLDERPAYFEVDKFIITVKNNTYNVTKALKYILSENTYVTTRDTIKYTTIQSLYNSLTDSTNHDIKALSIDTLFRFMMIIVNNFTDIIYKYADMVNDPELKIAIWENHIIRTTFSDCVDLSDTLTRKNNKWVFTEESGIPKMHVYVLLLGIVYDENTYEYRQLIKLGLSETWDTPRVITHLDGRQFPTAVLLYIYDTGNPRDLEKSCQSYLKEHKYKYKKSKETYMLAGMDKLHNHIKNVIYTEDRSKTARELVKYMADLRSSNLELAASQSTVTGLKEKDAVSIETITKLEEKDAVSTETITELEENVVVLETEANNFGEFYNKIIDDLGKAMTGKVTLKKCKAAITAAIAKHQIMIADDSEDDTDRDDTSD